MDSLISFIKTTIDSVFLFHFHFNVDEISKEDNKGKVVNYISKYDEQDEFNTNNDNSKIIDISQTHNQLSREEIDSKINSLYFKLKKNLETLSFIAELDFKLGNKPKLSQMVKDCHAIEKSIKIESIAITKQLSFYRSLRQAACA